MAVISVKNNLKVYVYIYFELCIVFIAQHIAATLLFYLISIKKNAKFIPKFMFRHLTQVYLNRFNSVIFKFRKLQLPGG